MKNLILAALVLASLNLFANEEKHQEAAAPAHHEEAAQAEAGLSKKAASAECKKAFKAEKKKATKEEFTACVEGKMGKK